LKERKVPLAVVTVTTVPVAAPKLKFELVAKPKRALTEDAVVRVRLEPVPLVNEKPLTEVVASELTPDTATDEAVREVTEVVLRLLTARAERRPLMVRVLTVVVAR
jgi:hypothetical protein